MSLKVWTSILSQWVKKTELAKVDDDLLQHFDIACFYAKLKEKTNPDLEDDLVSFLEARFPGFEILFDETRKISCQDHVYICSLILYYSCILCASKFIQKCSQKLDPEQQQLVMRFLEKLKATQDSKQHITKEAISAAIRDAIPTPPRIKFISSSPLKTPDKTTQTPNRSFEKAKELQKVKAMLDNERYERNLIEVELRTTEDKMDSLLKEQKNLKQELHKLRNEHQMIDRGEENLSPNKAIRDEQIRMKMQKEIDARDEIIANLRCEIEALTSKSEKSSNRMSMMEKEMRELRGKLCELAACYEDLKEEDEFKNEKILWLEETKNDLQSFISANRSGNKKDSSFDGLDSSFSTFNTCLNSTSSGENLAKSVVEVQLREKEAENDELKTKLETVSHEKIKLEGMVSAQRENIEALQEKLEEEKVLSKSLTNENALLKSGIQKSQETVESMRKDIKQQMLDVGAQLKAAEESRKDFEQLLESEKIKFDELRSQYENEISSSQQKIEDLQSEAETTSASHHEKVQELIKIHESEMLQSKFLMNELKAELPLITGKIEVLQEELKKEKDLNQQLTDNIKDITSSFESSTIENASLKSELQKSQETVESMGEEVERRMLDVGSQLKAAEESRKSLEQLLESEKIKYNELREQHEKEIAASQQKTEDLRSEAETTSASHHEKIQELSGKIEVLQEELNREKDLHKQLTDNIKELKSQLDSSTIENASVKSELQKSQETVESMREDFEKKMLDVAAQLKAAEESREMFEQLLESEKIKFDELREQYGKEIASSKQQIDDLRSKAETTSASHHKKIQELTEKIEVLQDELKGEKALYKEMKSSFELSTIENASLKSELQKSQETVENMREDFEQKMLDVGGQLKAAEESQKDFEKLLESEKIKYVELREQHEKEITSSQQKTEDLRREAEITSANHKSEIMQLDTLLNDLKAQLRLISEKEERLEENFKEEKALNQTLNDNINEMKSQLDSSTIENASLKSDLQKSQETVENMRKDFEQKILDVDSHFKAAEESRKDFEKLLESEKIKYVELREQHEKEITSSQQQIDELRSKAETTSASHHEKIQELSENHVAQLRLISKKVEVLQEELKGEKALMDHLNNNIKELKSQLETSTTENASLKQKSQETVEFMREDVAAQLKAAEESRKSLEQLLESEKIKFVELSEQHENKISSSQKQIEDLRRQADIKLASHHEKVQELTENHEAQLRLISGKIEVLQEELKEEKSLNQQLTDNVKEMTSRFESSTIENASLKSELQKSQEIAESMREDVERKILDVGAQLKAAEESRKVFEKLLESEKIKFDELREQHEKEITSRQQQIDELRKEVETTSVSHHEKVQELIKIHESELKAKLQEKDSTIIEMVSQIDELKVVYREQVNDLEQQLKAVQTTTNFDCAKVDSLLAKLKKFECLEHEMLELEKKHELEKETNQKNIEIFNAKLMVERGMKDEMKKNLEVVTKSLEECEKRRHEEVKNTRCELEGKLEKMKDRMKEIFAEEMKKKTQKHDEMSKAIQQQEVQLQQFQQRIKKLEAVHSRVSRDNECLKRENDFMNSKLRFLGESAARESIGAPRSSTTTHLHGANFGMEDEAGEEFNNLYLQDLQTGGSQMSLDLNNLYNAEELQKRNSMYPQHMRGSYALVGVDRNIGEQEMKDGGSIFDNSQTALLPTAGNKKRQGVTYNKPGPPTPGKTGGRLSLGLSSVLKDSNNQDNLGKKTPSRLLGLFNSKYKDENTRSPRRLSFFRNKK